ncbi:MAG: LysR substrate-binding domain-containing protein [Afipia sp.]
MNLRNIDLNLLTVFDAILSERSLTRASVKLHMTQPALSNALARLRTTLDDQLFIRTAQGMTPTPRAKQLAAPIRQALDLIQNGLRKQEAFEFETAKRKFVIAIGDYGEAVIMPRFVDWLATVAPHIQVQIRPELGRHIMEELRDGSIDLATDYFRIEGDEFHNIHVMDEHLVSMVRHDHPTIGDHLSIDDYTSIPHIVLKQDRPIVDTVLKRHGLMRDIALQVPHFLSMPLIVQKTDFICTLPKRMALVYADFFRTKVMKTPLDFPKIPIYFMWHQSVDEDLGHRWLRKALAELCHRL